MAGIIFDKGLKTYVPQHGLGEEGNCASACSFMFFGGSTRVADGKLGVHQFYSGSAEESATVGKTQSNAQFTVSEIIGFLNEFETPPFVFERMFQQQEMYYFNKRELGEITRSDEPIDKDDVSEIKGFIKNLTKELAKISDESEPEVAQTTQPKTSDQVTPRLPNEPDLPQPVEVETDVIMPSEELTPSIPTEITTTPESNHSCLNTTIDVQKNQNSAANTRYFRTGVWIQSPAPPCYQDVTRR